MWILIYDCDCFVTCSSRSCMMLMRVINVDQCLLLYLARLDVAVTADL